MKGKKKYSQWRFIAAFGVVMGLFAGVRHLFGIEVPLHVEKREMVGLVERVPTEEKAEPVLEEENLYATEDETIYEEVPDSLPYDSSHHDTVVNSPEDNLLIENPVWGATPVKGAHRIKGVWSYVDCFPDVQDVQIVAAQKYGITPVSNRDEADVLVRQHKLVNICHSPFYAVDELTHSIPYLVPRAQHLLNTICLNFIDSCQVKGLPIHLPIVTSVLRTTDDVSNLQRGNANATPNSCHCYGTTVDIAYNKFMPLTGTYESRATLLRWNEPMKQVLSEVLNDLRIQGRCYVKYERKQGCFHLTCR